MRALALVALLGIALFAAATVSIATGHFASSEGPAATIAGTGPLLHAEHGTLTRGVVGRARIALLAIPSDPETARSLAAALTEAGLSATFSLDATTVWRDGSLARDLVGLHHEIALAGLGPSDDAGLPVMAWRAAETLALRSVEGAAGQHVRIYAPRRLEQDPFDAAGATLALRAIDLGLVPVLPSAPDASGRDALVVIVSAADLASATSRARGAGADLVTVGALAGLNEAGAVDPLSTATTEVLALAARALIASSDVFALLSRLALALLLGRLILIMLAVGLPRRPRPVDAAPPRVAVLVPAHNEALGIGPAIGALLRSDLPTFEVIVVDDGSTDGTADAARAAAAGDDRVHVLEQPNRGKAAALSRAFGTTDAPVVVVVDADSIVEPSALRLLVAPLADPRIGAVAGNVKVGNRVGLLGALQHLEYVMGINLDRRLSGRLDAITVVPGALGAFRSDDIVAAGGFPEETLAEDADLTFALGGIGRRVVQANDARVWTEVPRDWAGLYRQRFRWAYGMLQVMWKRQGLVLSRRATNVGRIGLPFVLVFGLLLPMLAPAVDVAFVYGIVAGHRADLLIPLALFSLVQLLAAVLALRLDHESIAYAPLVLLYQLGYRQLLAFVVFRALIAAIAGSPVGWGRIRRHGLAARPA